VGSLRQPVSDRWRVAAQALEFRKFRRTPHWAQLERRTLGKWHYSSQVTLQLQDEVR
jgi:hypothetical protein